MEDGGKNEHIQAQFSEIVNRLELEEISSGEVLEKLDLAGDEIPEDIQGSVLNSSWFYADEGRTIVEVRSSERFENHTDGLINIVDLDDTLMATTQWHQQEYDRLASSEVLKNRGIFISRERAREIYDHSKLLPPGVNEPRYTPRANLILASVYARSLESGQTEDQAWEKMLAEQNRIMSEVAEKGDGVLDDERHVMDPDVVECLIENHTSDFLYESFVKDIFEGGNPDDFNIIATRGKPEGPFGQVHKAHDTQIMDRTRGESDIQLVIYTNDLKADAVKFLYKLVPGAKTSPVRIYDDNPSELDSYLNWAREHDLRDIDVIVVRHPDAKRRSYRTAEDPVHISKSDRSSYEIYWSSPKTSSAVY